GHRGRAAPHLDELRAGRRVAHGADREARRVLRRAAGGRDRGRRLRDVLAGRGPGVGLPLPGGAVRDTARPLPVARAVRAMFDLSLESMLCSRRSLFMALLLVMPVVFALLFRLLLAAHSPLTGFDLYAVIVALYDIRNVLPLTALFYATSLVADEADGKTLT